MIWGLLWGNKNNMTDQQATKPIENEFKERTLGVTEQYLEIHSPIYVDGNLKM